MKVFHLDSNEKKNPEKKFKQDRSKVCWKEVENEWFKDRATEILKY